MTQDSSSETRRIPPIGDPTPPEDLTFLKEQRERLKNKGPERRHQGFDIGRLSEGFKDLRRVPQSTKFVLERLSKGLLTTDEAEKFINERGNAQQREIQRLKAQIDRLGGAAMFDSLTGLPNRRSFDKELAGLLRSKKPFGIAYGDIDKFKTVNDTYGHNVGDQALRTAAQALASGLPESASVFRWGGDEFALLDSAATEENALFSVTDGARANVAAQSIEVGGGRDIAITMSFGGGIFRGSSILELNALKDRIDKEALLEGAKQTRNSVVIIR